MSLSGPSLRPGAESVYRIARDIHLRRQDVWPALKWSGVPAGTAELAITVLCIEPVDGVLLRLGGGGLGSRLQEIPSGDLPGAAVVGRNGFGRVGYSIRPPKGGRETYIFALYALPERLARETASTPPPCAKKSSTPPVTRACWGHLCARLSTRRTSQSTNPNKN